MSRLTGYSNDRRNDVNHLRELIDRTPHAITAVSDVRRHPDRKHHVNNFLCEAPKAVCFWGGDFDGICEMQVIPELCRLPYGTVWIEFDINLTVGRGLLGLLITESSSNEDLLCYGFLRYQNQWNFEFFVINLNLETGYCLTNERANELSLELASSCILAIRAFCSLLNCQNVGRQEHKPDAALQKARAKRGKQPLFSYWTLELNGRDGGAAQSFGGTHASPRVHLRRGHPRQYAPGKWTWVQPHAVGNRELGMVHKDYVIGKEMVVH